MAETKLPVVLIPSLEPDDRLPAYVADLMASGFSRVVVVNDGSSAAYQPIFDRIAELGVLLNTAVEADWLYSRFGEGKYTDVEGLCKSADLSEIEANGFSLTPGAYVGVEAADDDDVDFAARMREIHSELLSLQAESNDLMEAISKNMEEMGL